MDELVFSAGAKIAIGAMIWVFLSLLLLFHHWGAELVSGVFFIGAFFCMLFRPTSEAVWIFLLSGLMFYSYAVFKKKVTKPLTEESMER